MKDSLGFLLVCSPKTRRKTLKINGSQKPSAAYMCTCPCAFAITAIMLPLWITHRQHNIYLISDLVFCFFKPIWWKLMDTLCHELKSFGFAQCVACNSESKNQWRGHLAAVKQQLLYIYDPQCFVQLTSRVSNQLIKIRTQGDDTVEKNVPRIPGTPGGFWLH